MPKMLRENWIVLAMLVGISTAACTLLYLPQKKRLEAVKADIAAGKIEIAEQAAKTASVPELLRRVDEMQKQLNKFDRRLPQRRELDGFLREINTRLTEAGLRDALIEPGNPLKEELFNTLPIIMRFRGSYLSLANFLEGIHHMDRMACVHSVRIGQERGGDMRRGAQGEAEKIMGDTAKLDIELQLNIYFTSDVKI
ncbi:MAG: type 4a pilus biogenesis protein PilO [Planctomycetaceae bacterium]|nr:type 4a pilus biogenesis protein PilO [Planctomycetaceae bacterium]